MSILAKLEAFFSSVETNIETVLTPFEQTLIAKFTPLFKQIEANGEQQLVDLAEQTLTATLPAIMATGGNVGIAIAAAAPAIIKQLENDAHADLKNAAYGMLAATAATIAPSTAVVSDVPTASSASGTAA